MTKFQLVTLGVCSLGVAALSSGCATDSQTAENKIEQVQKSGANAAAKNAIYTAKIRNLRAKKVGFEWRDTDKMIKAAEAAASAGDNDKAIALAKKAAQQATAAIEQHKSETARYESNHGTAK